METIGRVFRHRSEFFRLQGFEHFLTNEIRMPLQVGLMIKILSITLSTLKLWELWYNAGCRSSSVGMSARHTDVVVLK